MGSGRRAHDLKAGPLPAAQGGLGTWAPSESCGRLPRRAQTKKSAGSRSPKFEGALPGPMDHLDDRNKIDVAETIQPS